MPKGDFNLAGYNDICSISWEIDQIKTSGGVVFPLLYFQAKLHIKPIITINQKTQEERIIPFTITALSGELKIPKINTVAYIQPIFCDFFSYFKEKGKDYPVNIYIPLSPSAIIAIEEQRKAEDLICELYLQILACLHQPIYDIKTMSPEKQPIIGFSAGEAYIRFTIPQSVWTKKLLPGLGFGQRHLLEITLPKISKNKKFIKAVKKLEEAWSAYREGRDAEVLRICYPLWETIAKPPDRENFKKILKDKKFHSDKGKHLANFLHSLAEFCHLARHDKPEEPEVPIDHRDAEFILLTTHIALAYLSKI